MRPTRSNCSNEYLTPQGTKKRPSKPRQSAGSIENLDIAASKEITDSFYEKLMSCPVKRQLVLNIINSEKNNIEEYKRNQAKEMKSKTPISKVKKKYKCESPTALHRRRALEKQNQDSTLESHRKHLLGPSSRSSSTLSNVSSCSSPIPFNKLLEGIIAYVEVIYKDEDKSEAAKVLLKAMGATVRDKFTKDVTHVIFKDGSFITYQKCKLMKVHLVSILWIEATRMYNMRVPEYRFPALGTDAHDTNVSRICSQIQKDYEEIIREELNRSLTAGTPLPSTETFIKKRRTLMTPNLFSQEISSSQDKEVEQILRSRRKMYTPSAIQSPLASRLSPELTSDDDDSDSGPVIDGSIVKRKSKASFNIQNYSDMDLTLLEKSTPRNRDAPPSNTTVMTEDNSKENCAPNTPDESIYNKKTPRLRRTTRVSAQESNRGTPNDSLRRRKTVQILDDQSKSNQSASSFSDSKSTTNTDTTSSDNTLDLEQTPKNSGLQILSKNVCANSDMAVNMVHVGLNSVVEIVTSDSVAQKSSSTNMSSLQISSNIEKITTEKAGETVSSTTSMSALLLTSDSSKGKSVNGTGEINSTNNVASKLLKKSAGSKSSTDGTDSFSPLKPEVVNDLLELLDSSQYKDDNVTKRKKQVYNTRRNTLLAAGGNVAKSDLKSSEKCLEDSSNSKRSTPNKDVDKNLKKNNKLRKTRSLKGKSILSEPALVQLSNSLTDVHITPTHPNRNPATEKSSSGKKTNKTRKLYNPDGSIKEIAVNDESERESKRQEVKKRKSDEGVVLNPNIVSISPNTLVTAKAKLFVDEHQINIKEVLSKDSGESESEAKLPKRQRTRRSEKKRFSEGDEQHQLAEEFINKPKNNVPKRTTKSTSKKPVITERRKSVRMSRPPKKKLNLESSPSKSAEQLPATNRRSTMDFQPISEISSKTKLKIDKAKHPSIVCTKLHKEEIQVFNQIVRKLGGFVIEDEVSRKTTHLVAGEPKRTINMLRAIAMGCWILKHEWLLRSLEEGKWLPEEDYEETDFSPAVQQCRLQRQAFGPTYTMDVFQDCGPIYIAKGTVPRCSDLRELVDLCKGSVCTIQRNAAIVVGEYVRHEGVKCVKEAWILDSITFNRKLSLRKYILGPSDGSPIV